MNKILSTNQAISLSKKLKHKNVVLVGGVFDIIHLGHIRFLENARKMGDYLFVLLESDQSVKKLKGKNRPINNQADRAEVLAALSTVNYIVKLRGILKDTDYDKIVKNIKPKVLATTSKDSYIFHKERQAKLIGAKLKIVVKRLKNKSTSDLLKYE